jgi:hypothetical protein|tara:strand:- start:220 stop:495 length:276 start_codon:yes stop_codon:yes gene_type:complete
MAVKPPKKSKLNTLTDLIDALPTADVGSADLKTLILQLILDTPSDDPSKPYANRSRVKLEALKLLSDINRNDTTSDYEAELLDILGKDEDE